jgi:hypothetical protein
MAWASLDKAQIYKYYATNRKVAGPTPDEVTFKFT